MSKKKVLTIEPNHELEYQNFDSRSLYGKIGDRTIFIVDPERTWLLVWNLKYGNSGLKKRNINWISCFNNHLIVKTFDFTKELQNEKINPNLLKYTNQSCNSETYYQILCLIVPFQKNAPNFSIGLSGKVFCRGFTCLYNSVDNDKVYFVDSNKIWLLIREFKYMQLNLRGELYWISCIDNDLIVKSFDFEKEIYHDKINQKLLYFATKQFTEFNEKKIKEICTKEHYTKSIIQLIGQEAGQQWIKNVNWEKLPETPVHGYNFDDMLPNDIIELILKYFKDPKLMTVSKKWYGIILGMFHKCPKNICDVKWIKIDLYGNKCIVPKQCGHTKIFNCGWCKNDLPHYVKVKKCVCGIDLIFGHACTSENKQCDRYVSTNNEVKHKCPYICGDIVKVNHSRNSNANVCRRYQYDIDPQNRYRDDGHKDHDWREDDPEDCNWWRYDNDCDSGDDIR